jgi:hypothetical protein
MAEMRAIRIASEEDAWDALKNELGPIDVGAGPVNLVFVGWPYIEIHLPQTPEEATIAPSMMEALVEFQRTIYRAHTLLASDTGNLRTLSRMRPRQKQRVQKLSKLLAMSEVVPFWGSACLPRSPPKLSPQSGSKVLKFASLASTGLEKWTQPRRMVFVSRLLTKRPERKSRHL